MLLSMRLEERAATFPLDDIDETFAIESFLFFSSLFFPSPYDTRHCIIMGRRSFLLASAFALVLWVFARIVCFPRFEVMHTGLHRLA